MRYVVRLTETDGEIVMMPFIDKEGFDEATKNLHPADFAVIEGTILKDFEDITSRNFRKTPNDVWKKLK